MNISYIKYLLALLLFASNGIVADGIDMNTYEIVFLRSVLGAALLLLIYTVGKKGKKVHLKKRDVIFVILSGIAMAGDWLFLFEAYAQIGVSLGMLINYTGPVIVMILSVFIFKEKLTVYKIIAVLSALAGAFLISGKAAVSGLNLWGLFCAVISAFFYAGMVIFNKLAEDIKGMDNATIQLSSACVTVVLVFLWKQGFHLQIPADDIFPILWLGFINTGLSCYFYFSSIGNLPVHTVAISGYLEPLSAVVMAMIFLGERMTAPQFVGAFLIIFGAAFGELAGSGKKSLNKGKQKKI